MNVQTKRVPSKCLVCLIVVIAIVSTASEAMALYAQAQLINTPIDRLVDNLTKQVEAKPKDAKLRHNLARVYAMAYASKSETAQTTSRADKKTAAILTGSHFLRWV